MEGTPGDSPSKPRGTNHRRGQHTAPGPTPIRYPSDTHLTPIRHQITLLLAVLEDCVAFLVSIGTSEGVHGETLLSEYALETLLLDPEAWHAASPEAVTQAVRLRHIQGLYLALEAQKGGGGQLASVPPPYKDALDEEYAAAVTNWAATHEVELLQQPRMHRAPCTVCACVGLLSARGLTGDVLGCSDVRITSMAWSGPSSNSLSDQCR
jgi:hypothetical protein